MLHGGEAHYCCLLTCLGSQFIELIRVSFRQYQTSIPNSELEHDGCARVCHFALDILKAVRAYNCDSSLHDLIELRVGIATGQVVAGED